MLISVGEVENVEEPVVELGCRVEGLPSTYLRMPLGAPKELVAVWGRVEERMRKRLALWKSQYLLKGGRVTLIKSTLASLPLHQMSLVRMPKSVAGSLGKIHRDFL